MTIVASLLFVVALVASIAVMLLTIHSAMPRIREVVDRRCTICSARTPDYIGRNAPSCSAQIIAFRSLPQKRSPLVIDNRARHS